MSVIRLLGLAAAVVGLTGCMTGTRHQEPVARPEMVGALARERDSLWIRTLALAAQGDALRASATRLDVELQERNEELRAVRLELQRLKEVDLRSQRRPPR